MKKDIIPFYQSGDKLIVKSDDCSLYDSDGKVYIDFESGVWCANIGHSNTQIIKRVTEQINTSIHHGYQFRNQYAEDLSVKLQQLIGFENGASVFLSSGSEAVNLSITLARYFTGKNKILKIDNSYLSAFGPGQISDENDVLVNITFDDTGSIETIDFNDIAAFVMETGGASAGMVRFPSEDFIHQLTEACRRHNCLIIAEEVTTGMGRTGKWFGFQHYRVIPDILVTGKALGNGFPISSVTLNARLADQFGLHPFRYAQSHQNDPLGCSIALEVIKVIGEQKLIDKARTTGGYFRSKLENLRRRFPEKIKDIRARGLMLAIEFTELVNGEWISQQLFENGLVTGFKQNTLRFLPPLTIQHKDIDQLTDKLDDLLA
ncbi:aspartate aminotransferase family protein [Saccharicrinis sp. FJH54]|uniref:class-III pyridoxal-phosphate-dependent aminotransferase n=1 Tax=Saccharicrinis sp. FJH54 TaxID=3344665 RepID=UPI0035D46323